jgi:hypothetical protein
MTTLKIFAFKRMSQKYGQRDSDSLQNSTSIGVSNEEKKIFELI